MGRKAGIALAALGLITALFSTAMYVTATAGLSALAGAQGLGFGAMALILQLGAMLILGLISFILSALFYLAAYLTSRRIKSKAIGVLLIIGGILILLIAVSLFVNILPISGSLQLVAFGLLHVAVALLLIVAGLKTARRPEKGLVGMS